MKYYSEKLKTTFNTEKECLNAEASFQTKESIEKSLKKQYSQRIENAETKLTNANHLYNVAKEKAKKILEDSNKQIEEILKAAQTEVEKASTEKLNAICEFNKKFGNYTTTLTGEKAAIEAENYLKDMRSMLYPFTEWFSKIWF